MAELAESPIIIMPSNKRSIIEAAQEIFKRRLNIESKKTRADLEKALLRQAPEIRGVADDEATGLSYAIAITDELLKTGQVDAWAFCRGLATKDGKMIAAQFQRACQLIAELLTLNNVSELAEITPDGVTILGTNNPSQINVN